MINWILTKMVNRLDTDINEYRRKRKGEILCACAFSELGAGYIEDKEFHEQNASAYRANIEWCIKWRNRMARRVGIPALMAW